MNHLTYALIVLSFWTLACASTSSQHHGVKSPSPVENHLPNTVAELITLADRNAEDGPGGHDLERSVRIAEKIFQISPNSPEAHWRAARAIFYLILAQPDRLDGSLSQRCLDYGQTAIQVQASASAHLYSALCMGLRAQFAPMEGLSLVKKMLKHAERVNQLDATLDHAAGARLLGGIYMKAPAWPTSVGDIEMAIEFLEKAVTLVPDWPENVLLLAEAYYTEDRIEDARNTLQKAKHLVPDQGAWTAYFVKRIKAIEEEFED
jgi:tetratricopeptide (TPR) repeat protein